MALRIPRSGRKATQETAQSNPAMASSVKTAGRAPGRARAQPLPWAGRGANLVLRIRKADLAEVDDLLGLVDHAQGRHPCGAELLAGEPMRDRAVPGAQGHGRGRREGHGRVRAACGGNHKEGPQHCERTNQLGLLRNRKRAHATSQNEHTHTQEAHTEASTRFSHATAFGGQRSTPSPPPCASAQHLCLRQVCASTLGYEAETQRPLFVSKYYSVHVLYTCCKTDLRRIGSWEVKKQVLSQSGRWRR